jgi:ABC-type phosphate transport system permease subunit
LSLYPLSFQQAPIIVKLTEPQGDPTGLGHLIISALGLAGVIGLIAISIGVIIGALLFLARARSREKPS